MADGPLILCLPSKGSLSDGVVRLFEQCLIPVRRTRGARSYEAHVEGFDDVRVLLARATDIPSMLDAEQAHVGITGLDLVGRLTGSGPVPGVGFGLAVEHLLRMMPPPEVVPTVVAVVAPAVDGVSTTRCVAVASALRAGGLACRLGGSDPTGAARDEGVPVLVVVGADDGVTVAELRSGRERPATLADVAVVVREALDG